MILAVSGIVVCSLLSLFYIFSRAKMDNFWASVTRAFTTLSFIAFSLMIFFNYSGPYSPVYGFLVLSLVFATIGDFVAERKDVSQEKEYYFIGSVIMFAAHTVLAFLAFILLIWEFANWLPITIAGAIAVFGASIVLFVCKMLKVDFKKLEVHTFCYFFTNILLFALSIWYNFVLPDLLFFTIYAGLIFVNNLILIKLNFGNKPGKKFTFFVHRLIYYSSLIFLVTFIYFDLINLMG